MTRDVSAQPRVRRKRSDAEQNAAMILRVAIDALNADPAASVEEIARAAGVTRQTVYAHFPSRDALIGAVMARAAAETAAAFEAAHLDDAPPAEALMRMLDAGWQVSARYPFLWHLQPVSADADFDRHGPVVELLQSIIRRGQDHGDFDPGTPPNWLIAAALALGRAAGEEVNTGRMTIEEATSTVHRSFLRLFGVLQDDRSPRRSPGPYGSAGITS